MNQEHESFAEIKVGDERYNAHRGNTSVFRHLGQHALYDHVFIEIDDNHGVYIWSDNLSYPVVATLAVENECSLHLNLREVADIDRKAYENNAIKSFTIPDSLPDDFKV